MRGGNGRSLDSDNNIITSYHLACSSGFSDNGHPGNYTNDNGMHMVMSLEETMTRTGTEAEERAPGSMESRGFTRSTTTVGGGGQSEERSLGAECGSLDN